MTPEQAREQVALAILKVAPEAADEVLSDDVHLRDDLELDSMDFLQLMIRVKKDLKVEVPEADYGQLSTVGDLAAYVVRHGEAE